jgi:ferritin
MMAITKAMEKEFNTQINEEFSSSYLYLAMAAWFEEQNYPGFASWMRYQAKEELEHGMKFFDHLVERGGRPVLAAIPVPQKTWKSPLDAFKASLHHEQHITARINTMMEKAMSAKDYPSVSLLHWFVDEQVEEEAAVEGIIAKMEMSKGSAGTLLMFDHQLGKRGKK